MRHGSSLSPEGNGVGPARLVVERIVLDEVREIGAQPPSWLSVGPTLHPCTVRIGECPSARAHEAKNHGTQ